MFLTKVHSFKGLYSIFYFSGSFRYLKITANTVLRVIFPQYYSADLGHTIKCMANNQIQSCYVEKDHTVVIQGFNSEVRPGVNVSLSISGIRNPLITDANKEDIFIGAYSVKNINNYTHYCILDDVATSIRPSMLFLEKIELENTNLLDYSNY